MLNPVQGGTGQPSMTGLRTLLTQAQRFDKSWYNTLLLSPTTGSLLADIGTNGLCQSWYFLRHLVLSVQELLSKHPESFPLHGPGVEVTNHHTCWVVFDNQIT
eukprot:6926113-Ditylum_brightwellii.AAC.1